MEPRFIRPLVLVALALAFTACITDLGPLPAASPAAATPAAATAAPPPSKPSPPALRLPHTASPVRYALSLTVVPGNWSVEGAVDIDIQIAEPSAVVWLNATELTIHEAHLEALGRLLPAHVQQDGDDFVGFAFDEVIPAGPARLHVAFAGKVNSREHRGLFANYDEQSTSYVLTHFESIDARRAFPCFDEPSYKVPWQLTLHVPERDTALSNTLALSETPEGAGMKAVRFKETKPLPSYLVALAVGPFDLVSAGKAGKNGTPVRIAVPHGQAAQARYAAEIAPTLVTRLEELLGVPFPYEKLDMVAAPRSAMGMENAGLIVIKRSLLLAEPREETLAFKMEMARVATHELGHHWFGDLVTMEWWDDIWLNEAFAEWIEAKILSPWRPEWPNDLMRGRQTAWAMFGDALANARRVRQPIVSNDDIHNAFDEITYGKGSAVIGMFEHWIGPDRFRAGLRRYLDKHAHGNATTADLFAALSVEAGRDTSAAFSSFLEQPGVPLVSAELSCAKENQPPEIMLAQEPFRLTRSEDSAPQTWQIPVCVRWGKGKAQGRACTLLAERTAKLVLSEARDCPDWILPNEGSLGYYRVAYTAPMLAALFSHQASKALSLPERLGLMRDVRGLAANGRLPMAEVLSRLPGFLEDSRLQVLGGAVDLVASIPEEMIPEADRARFARFLATIFGARARALGWKSKPNEDAQARLLRPELLALVADRAEDRVLTAEAAVLARRWLDDPQAVDTDTIDAVLTVAAQHGDRALFDRLRAEATKAEADSRRRYVGRALASFRDPAIVKDALSLVLTGEAEGFRGAMGLLFEEPRMGEMTYDFVKQKFDALLALLPSDIAGDLPYVAAPFCDEAHRADVEAFFKDRVANLLHGPRNLAKVLERIRLCAAQRRAQEASFTTFLKRY